MAGILTHLRRLKNGRLDALSSRFTRWTNPLGISLPLSTLTHLSGSKSEPMAENALLREPLIILKRQVKRPACTKTDACSSCSWQEWFGPGNKRSSSSSQRLCRGFHRELFRLVWKHKSKAPAHKPKIASETIK